MVSILAVAFYSAITLFSVSFAAECQNWQTIHPDWIFCDDFESSDPLVESGRWYSYDSASGNFSLTPGIGYNGSQGMKAVWTTGAVNEGSLQLFFGRNPISNNGIYTTQDFREIYYRMYVKLQSGWTGNPYKLSRAIVFSASDWSEAAIAHLWGDSTTHLLIDPASCVTGSTVNCVGYNDMTHLKWLGAQSGTTPLFDGQAVHDNTWYCIEAHVKLNDPGQSNGIQEFWINGNLETSKTGLNFVGSYTSYGINAIFLENYWNTGATQNEDRYFDNIVVSTQQIGCAEDSNVIAAPNPPQNLTIH